MTKRAASKSDTEAPQPGRIWLTRASDLILGGLMLVSGGFLLTALLSHNALDPSWNVSAEGDVRNLMGRPGAGFSDVMLQSLGWSAAGPAIALIIWGGVLLLRRPRRRPASIAGWRWLAAAIGTTGFAAAASALPLPNAWPFASGLGGALGDMALGGLRGLPASLDLPAATGIGAAFGLVFAIAGIFFTFGLRSRDLSAAYDAAGLAWATVRVWFDALRGHGMSLARLLSDTGTRSDARDEIIREEPVLRRAMRAADGDQGDEHELDDAPQPAFSSSVKVAPTRRSATSERDHREAQGSLAFARTQGFKLPRLDLLAKPQQRNGAVDELSLRQNAC